MSAYLSPEALGDIAAFLFIFETPDFQFAQNDSPLRQTGENSFEMVGHNYNEQVYRLMDTLAQHGWVHSSDTFQWPNWKVSDEAIALRDDPAALAAATPEQLARLLTVMVRQERFPEGTMLSFWDSGLLLAFCAAPMFSPRRRSAGDPHPQALYSRTRDSG